MLSLFSSFYGLGHGYWFSGDFADHVRLSGVNKLCLNNTTVYSVILSTRKKRYIH